MRDFRRLDVWHRAHQLTLSANRSTAVFPKHERYGLAGQLRRSSASIAANIAEGCGRSSAREFARFLSIAAGSTVETEYHLPLARDLEYLQESVYRDSYEIVQTVKRMITSLIRRIKDDEKG